MKSGLILVSKRSGMTSFDCIRHLKKIWKRTDLGHGGTLDRFATGLLPVFAGEGLKLVRFFLENHPHLSTYWKTYEGTFVFGTATATGDPEGEITETKALQSLNLTPALIAQAMQSFVDKPYEQTPPIYSAKKIAGERASKLTREGQPPQLKPVLVSLKRFECLGVEGNEVHFRVECSKGTYVRALATDLAARLESVAYVRTLVRTHIGPFFATQALTLEQIGEKSQEQAIHDLQQATCFLPRFNLTATEADLLKTGKTDGITARLANSGLPPSAYCAGIAAQGDAFQPLALLELSDKKHAAFLRAFKN